MKLIVGLGNPGISYRGTRHNIGSYIVRAFAHDNRADLKRGLFSNSMSAKVKIEGHESILALPLVYMNLSGLAVSSLVKKHRIALEDLLIVSDDIDMELGALRIRPSGSSGGHNGLQSVIDCLGSQDFARLKVGIGRPPSKSADVAEYVLSEFSRKEKEEIKDIAEEAAGIIKSWIIDGMSKTMNIFNRKGK